jgi:hypothetical protein
MVLLFFFCSSICLLKTTLHACFCILSLCLYLLFVICLLCCLSFFGFFNLSIFPYYISILFFYLSFIVWFLSLSMSFLAVFFNCQTICVVWVCIFISVLLAVCASFLMWFYFLFCLAGLVFSVCLFPNF